MSRAALHQRCDRPCHPGPCPPCLISVEQSCHCGKEVLVNRCLRLQEDPNPSLSCGRVCGKLLLCGKHFCTETCHPRDCSGCLRIETVRCYCGKENKSVPCGNGEPKACSVLVDGEVNEWEGRYECNSPCGQPYACGIHKCESVSHSLSVLFVEAHRNALVELSSSVSFSRYLPEGPLCCYHLPVWETPCRIPA